MKVITNTVVQAALVLSSAIVTQGAVSPFYSDSGVKDMGSSQSWAGGGFDTKSVAFEVTIDFTTAVDNLTDPIHLLDLGGDGTGSGLVIDGDNFSFFASGGTVGSLIATGAHGLTAGTTGVQIVATYEIDSGTTAGNELLQIYVNGSKIAETEGVGDDDWAGGDRSGLGTQAGSNAQADNFFGTIVDYPETNISLNAYWLASDGGPADNTISNIAVPEPSTFMLLGLLGGIALLRRR